MALLRRPLLALAGSESARAAVAATPLSAALVRRYVPGETTDEAVEAAAALVADGLDVTLDFLGEDTTDQERAEQTADAYVEMLAELSRRGLSRRAEVSVKLSAIGRSLPDGDDIALANAERICRAARNAGTTVTLDMEDHTTVDATLMILRELRKEHPETGAVLQAYLHRTEDDARALAYEGSRVRLCKGAYDEPSSVAFTSRDEIDRSFVRCLRVLMAGHGHPMVATHDPRLIDIAGALASRRGREQGSYEFQMLYGIRPEEQRRLAEDGEKMRIYLPYGDQWWGYLVRRLAERPSNLSLFLTSLVSKD